jgi:hypothetical protein
VIAITPTTTNSGNIGQLVPFGYDGGNGFSKLSHTDGVIVSPSYFLELRSASESPNVIEYLDGPRTDLKSKRWVTGDAAYLESPLAHQRVVDEKLGKLELGLQMFLGNLQRLPQQISWNIALSLSIQDAEVLGDRLRKSFDGSHIAEINGRETTVNISARVFEEGRGVIISAIKSSVLKSQSQTILLDLGYGTTITAVFSGTQLVKQSRTIHPNGVRELVEAIAKHPQTRASLGNEGDRAVIRRGIEDGSFDYGCSGWNFRDIYTEQLPVWVRTVLTPALKPVAPWKPRCESVIATGGGSLLPGINQLLAKHQIATIPDAQTANSRGLFLIAQHSVKGGI